MKQNHFYILDTILNRQFCIFIVSIFLFLVNSRLNGQRLYFSVHPHSDQYTKWQWQNRFKEIEPNIYILEAEVSIREWINFIGSHYNNESLYPDLTLLSYSTQKVFNDLKNNNGANFLKLDTITTSGDYDVNIWAMPNLKTIKELNKADSLDFSLDLPITGVSYKQVIQFIEWREYYFNSGRIDSFKVRLPTPLEYEKWITNIDSMNRKKCYQINVENCSCKNLNKKNARYRNKGKYVMSVFSFYRDKNELYCMQGNACEMTSIENVAKGGSYFSSGFNTYSDKIQLYSKPEPWLGFRYIIELVK